MAHPQPFAPSPASNNRAAPNWSPASWEARLVAGSLRSTPVTLVHGADAAERDAFLTRGVMPLLGRRREDRIGGAQRAAVLPFPDRRHALGRGAAPAELVLLIDDWSGQPLLPLAAHIERAQATSDQQDDRHADDDEPPGRVLLVMQNFEAALAAAARAIHPDRFWSELAQASRIQPHGLQLLVMTDEADTPALRWLRGHLPALGDHALRLQPPQPGVELDWTPVPGLTGDAAAKDDPEDALPAISDQEWLEAVQGAVDRAAGRSGAMKVPASAPVPAASPAAAAVGKPAMKSVKAPAGPEPVTSEGPAFRSPVDVAPATAPKAPAAPEPAPLPEPAPIPPPAAARAESAALRRAPERVEATPAAPAPATRRTADLADKAPAAAGPRPVAAPAPRWLLPVAGVAACAALAAVWWSHRPFGPTPDLVAVSEPALTSPAPQATAPSHAEPAEPAPVAVVPTPPIAMTVPAVPATPVPPSPAPPVAAIPATPSPALPAPPAMPTSVDTEPGSALRRLLAGLPLLDLRVDSAQTAARLAAAQRPTLALVRYDTLRKLPASAGLQTLSVVAPLFVEPVQVWVRADASPRRLDDLGQGQIDVGRNPGDAAGAAGVTEALFGKPTPAARQRRLPDTDALAALQRGEVDAVLRVEASALTARAAAAVAKGELRTLTLDRSRAASARALRDYLPAPVASATGDRTLGVMNFLVVQGGDAAARQRLAGDALQALCTGLPALKASAGPVWEAVRPDLQLPAGRPYALAAGQAGAASAGCSAVASTPALKLPHPPTTPKGNLS